MTPLAFSSIQFKGAGQTLAGGKISVRSQFVTSQRADYTFFFEKKATRASEVEVGFLARDTAMKNVTKLLHAGQTEIEIRWVIYFDATGPQRATKVKHVKCIRARILFLLFFLCLTLSWIS